MKNILLLASSSASRKQLLTDAAIPFVTVPQDADESACDWGMSLQKVVEHIAIFKMAHVIMPTGADGQEKYVLTADTLTLNKSGEILGKPTSREQAIAHIKSIRAGVSTGTAFCLEKKLFHDNAWHTSEQIVRFVQAEYQFNVPDAWIERYFEASEIYQKSGAIAIEGFGALFLKEVRGSYYTIVGLPLFELRESLEKIGFFDQL